MKLMAKSVRKGQEQEININLMPQEEARGALGASIKWALGVGRYLIIGTQIVALVAFGLSLKLTIDKNTLITSIENAKNVIESKAEFEQEFREIQDKLVNIDNLRSEQFKSNVVLKEFSNLLPTGMNLTSLNISDGELSFSGEFPTAAQLHTLINSFNSSRKIVSLEIIELNSPTEDTPQFSFDAKATILIPAFTAANIKAEKLKQTSTSEDQSQEGTSP